MIKVKEMETCLGTGKVCRKVRSNYDQLASIMSLRPFKDGECVDTRVYDVVNQAMANVKDGLIQKIRKTCVKCEAEIARQELDKADEAVMVAIRESQEPFNKVWLSLNVNLNVGEEKLAYEDFCKLGQDACRADADCIAAQKAIVDAQKVQRAAREVLKMKLLYSFATGNEI